MMLWASPCYCHWTSAAAQRKGKQTFLLQTSAACLWNRSVKENVSDKIPPTFFSPLSCIFIHRAETRFYCPVLSVPRRPGCGLVKAECLWIVWRSLLHHAAPGDGCVHVRKQWLTIFLPTLSFQSVPCMCASVCLCVSVCGSSSILRCVCLTTLYIIDQLFEVTVPSCLLRNQTFPSSTHTDFIFFQYGHCVGPQKVHHLQQAH